GQLLDGLMRRTIFTQTDGIVGEDIIRRDLHQNAEAHAGAHVIAEIKERGAEAAKLRQRHAVDHGVHGVFAYAKVDVAPAIFVRIELAGAIEGQVRFVRFSQVRRAADKPRDILRQDVQRFSGGFPRGYSFRIGGEIRQVFVPAFRQLTSQHAVDLIAELWELLFVLIEFGFPRSVGGGAPLAHAIFELIVDAVRNEELGILRPAVILLHQLDFGLTEWLAVRFIRILFVGRTIADVTIDDDER